MFARAHWAIRFILIALTLGFGPATLARAEVSSDCGPWTWFPDFRCEERSARPEGAFNPVGMPYLFEDPYITSNLNFAYIYHRLPEDPPFAGGGTPFPVFDGGGVHVLALQIRLALTDRLALIATKDGLAMLRPGSASAVDEETGIFDMTVGFKYALFESREHDFILSPAIRYEIPLGDDGLFQGNGDGVFIPSASFRWGLGDLGLEAANLVGSLGGQVPIDDDRGVRSLFYNIHLDYGFAVSGSVIQFIVPFIELNGIHYTSSGAGTNTVFLSPAAATALGASSVPLAAAQAVLSTGAFEGVDVANLGSPGIDGADVLVMGGGIRVPTTWGVSFAVMYEGPVTSRKDIHNQRFTFMATWEL